MAAGATYEPIATTTLGSAQSSVTFSSIPQTYTDLVLVANVSASSTTYISGQVNGDTAGNYSSTWIDTNGSTVTSGRTTNATSYGSARTNPDNVTILHYMNYSNTTTYKTILERINTAGAGASFWTALWRNNAAITSITLFTDSANNWSSGSTFTLYGIAAA